MHVTMTQGQVVVDVSLTRQEAEHLQTILDYSHLIWSQLDYSGHDKQIEKTARRLFNALSKLRVESVR